MALDYLQVKRIFAEKLANDADGIGRFESAFYHTMKFVYGKGVEDGQANCHQKTAVDDQNPTIGVTG